MMKRTSPESAINFSRTIRLISGGVSVTRKTFYNKVCTTNSRVQRRKWAPCADLMKSSKRLLDPPQSVSSATSAVDSCKACSASFPGRAFAKELGNIEVHKVGVMENDRVD